MRTRSNLNMQFRYLLCRISPKLNIKFLFWVNFRRRLNLRDPKTLDEKLQWMKLYYYKNNPLVSQCADKWRVREYVKACGLEHILNPVIKTYRHGSEIDWAELPQRFVLKWNFGCGGNLVCLDKAKLDTRWALEEIERFRKTHQHLLAAEPQYKMEKVLLAESFIEGEDGGCPVDYKVYCFHGEPKYVMCCYGREEYKKPAFYFFDRQWNLQRINRAGKAAPEGFSIPKPEGIDEVFRCAEVLSKPFPFVRADFYLEKGVVYFGELTFTPSGGFDKSRLPETDKMFGDMVRLPQKNV